MIGDSKVIQWQSAIEQIANDQGWHVYSYIKSACAFSTGVQVAKGDPYTSCEGWNEQMLPLILDQQPDVVIVSNRTATAMADPPDTNSRTSQAMEDALAERWTQLTDAGIPVVVMLDSVSPGDISVYECVADNLDDLQACTFDREEGIERSAAPVQQAAAERVPGVQTIDMTDIVCPEETCVPVIGNVLVYRQTSHITDTYVRTLTPDLADRLVPAVDEAVE